MKNIAESLKWAGRLGLALGLGLVSLAHSVAAASGDARPSGGGDWEMFRGQSPLLGVAPGSLSSTLELAWTFKTEQPVRSSAAVVGARVYVGSNDDGCMRGVDDRSGLIWNFKTGGEVESSPLVLEGRVYVGSGDGKLYALAAANGTKLWEYETADRILGAPNWFRSGDRASDSGGQLRLPVARRGRYDGQEQLGLRNRQLHQRRAGGGGWTNGVWGLRRVAARAGSWRRAGR